MRTNFKLATLGALAVLMAVPAATFAADRDWRHDRDRAEWRNIGLASAVVGVAGLLSHNSVLACAGAAGVVYSGIRVEDRGPRWDRDRVVIVDRDRHWDRDRDRDFHRDRRW